MSVALVWYATASSLLSCDLQYITMSKSLDQKKKKKPRADRKRLAAVHVVMTALWLQLVSEQHS